MGRMRVVAVVLAAGEGRRMGGPKALLPLGETTFLAHACRLLARPGVASVVAVVGAEAERVRAGAGLPPGATVVVNDRWREGMLSSVGRGLDAAEAGGADAVLLHPVDHPLVQPSTIDRVIQALSASAPIAVPTWDGRRGHPGGFHRSVFGELRAAPPDRGARAVLAADPGRVAHVAGDPGCLVGIDTPEDYARAIMTPVGDASESVFERERRFHDGWASATAAPQVRVRAAFEAITAPENRFILRTMGELPGRRLLDLGSGLGEAAVYFALRGARVTATDISPEMCALAAETARRHGVEVETIAAPVERLDVPEGSFDLVYGANLLHHVADVDRTLGAVRRALRPGGRCFFWDPLAYNPAIDVYRRIATAVRTADEHPLDFSVLSLFRKHFTGVRHREFWLTTLLLFAKYYLVDRVHPNADRYWKRILDEDPARIGWWFSPLQRADDLLLRLPLVRRLAWNTVIWAERPA
jgi:CTP:molybdopterin cytidylyltransferase MocA/predicted O-methyltransferase YrrM